MARGLLAIALSVQFFTISSPPAQVGTETKSIPVKSGDTLVIHNDRGSVRIRPARIASIEVQIRKRPRNPAQAASLRVEFQRNAETIAFTSVLSFLAGDAVDFDVQAPDFVNVMIAGATPSVDIGGMRGTVRIEDRAGIVRAEDLTSSVSLTTEKGDVVYRANLQPLEDVHIQSTSGNIYFEIKERLNLRCQFHAGGTITWNLEPAGPSKSLEKQLGTRGPLLHAGTEKGNLEFRYMETPYVIGSAASIQPPRARENPGKDAKQAVETPKLVKAPPDSKRETTAGTQQASSVPETYSLKVSVDAVSLNVSVVDRDSGRSLGQLQREDFLVYEEGVLQQVDELGRAEAPFNLLLLLDVSGSTESFLPLMKQATVDFTRQIKANDRMAVATFNSHVHLIQNFTNDRDALAHSIQRIMAGGGTAFYDALMTCIDEYMRDIESRSAIVVFTDGVDNQLFGEPSAGSMARFPELYRRIQEIEPIIYPTFLDTEGMFSTSGGRGPANPGQVIDILGTIIRGGKSTGTYPPTYPNPMPNPVPAPRRTVSPAESRAYAEAMQQLIMISEQTGGRFYSPRRIEELSKVYAQIADDLRIQYHLFYTPTNPKNDGKWREIRVQIKNRPNAVVRTRKGYYARK